jgi:ABC-type Fe3+/spermidine/putrescine transport system ATPase subunit
VQRDNDAPAGAAPAEPPSSSPRPPALRCRSLTVTLGSEPVLRGLDLTVEPDQVMALLGPSGSGKTTLLHTVAGFIEPSAGELWLGGRRVAGVRRGDPPERRDVGMVFQQYALWPHLTALQTVAYPLRRRRVPAAIADRQAMELLERMDIGHLAGRRPAELSGGQQQRVGLARALARGAGLYLLDEPTVHLDAALRTVFQEEFIERRKATGAAALYATHDAAEALAVADRVALIRQGGVMQTGTPVEVYERPVDLWAAQLTGPASVLEVQVHRTAASTVAAVIAGVPVVVAQGEGGSGSAARAAVLVRPGWAALGGSIPGTIRQVWYRGAHTDYRLDSPAGPVIIRQDGSPRARAGERVSWTLQRGWIIDRP